jgi:hypothetical protein
MRRVLSLAAGGAWGAASPAAAAAPRVPVMVVGRTAVLGGPRTVSATATTVAVGGRRCALAAGTALSALAALRRAGGPAFHVRDYGGCSRRRAAASESLYVDRIARDRSSGPSGWVYKLGHRAPDVGGASPHARARSGQPVLWFYCRMGRTGCQRTLEVTGPTRPAPGAAATFSVRGYDDRGRGVPVGGATVAFGASSGTTAADGRVALTAPANPGRARVTAVAAGLVPAFPLEVVVG